MGRRCSPWLEMWLSVRIWYLAMPLLEFLHVVDQRLHAFEGHGVVDRSAYAADRAVTLELDHAALRRAFEEDLIQFFVAQLERHVHARTVFLAHRAQEKLRSIEVVVQQPRLGDVLLLDRCQTALRLQPLENEAGDVDGIGCGS